MSTYQEATTELKSKGMKKLSGSKASREYWGYGERDVFFDHSATITKLNRVEWKVSDFSDMRK